MMNIPIAITIPNDWVIEQTNWKPQLKVGLFVGLCYTFKKEVLTIGGSYNGMQGSRTMNREQKRTRLYRPIYSPEIIIVDTHRLWAKPKQKRQFSFMFHGHLPEAS